MRKVGTLTLLAWCVILADATHAIADGNSPSLAQVVALDECNPVTFNAAVGPDFCKNVTLGAFYDIVRSICRSGGRNRRSGLGLRT
jgi:hypothetical protein